MNGYFRSEFNMSLLCSITTIFYCKPVLMKLYLIYSCTLILKDLKWCITLVVTTKKKNILKNFIVFKCTPTLLFKPLKTGIGMRLHQIHHEIVIERFVLFGWELYLVFIYEYNKCRTYVLTNKKLQPTVLHIFY